MENINSDLIGKIYKALKNKETEIQDIRLSGENWVGNATKIIKKTIADIGRNEFNLYVATSKKDCDDADEGEWLLDLVLYEMKEQDEFSMMKSIPLVVESEFSKTSYGGFKEDFDKLFIATSSERLFIMRINNPYELDKILKYGKESVEIYEPFKIGDSIHLIYWDEIGDKSFKYVEFKKN